MTRLSTPVLFFTLLQASGACFAQTPLPPPEATDPAALQIMVGSPPPPDKRVTLANALQYPNPRWAYHHMSELGQTTEVWRGAERPSPLRQGRFNHGSGPGFEHVTFDNGTGKRITLEEWRLTTYTDALLVLHQGEIALERYYIGMKPQQRHSIWSISKSIVGLLTTMMIHDGTLDPSALISSYIPELQGSAWGNATLQQTLDMTTSVAFVEDLRPPPSSHSGLIDYLRAGGFVPRAPDAVGPAHLYDYLATLYSPGVHGAAFHYKSIDCEVLGWVLARVSGKPLPTLVSERLWSKLGVEEDGYYWQDPIGTDVASVGMSATLRDLGRFAEMVRREGRYNNRQIVPPSVIREIRKGGDRNKFAAAGQTARHGYSYHNQWWISHDADGTFEAKGRSGQHLHINPKAGVVIVKLSSHPLGETLFTHTLDRAAFAAITRAVRGQRHSNHDGH